MSVKHLTLPVDTFNLVLLSLQNLQMSAHNALVLLEQQGAGEDVPTAPGPEPAPSPAPGP